MLSQIFTLPKINDLRGNLTFIESNKHIPFEIKRVFWIYDVPGGEVRGGHAYKCAHEFIIALSGSFEVVTNDGTNNSVWQLNRSYNGLLVPAGNWRQMKNFSTNSLALVITSTYFDKSDYIYDYDKFLEMTETVLTEELKEDKLEKFLPHAGLIDFRKNSVNDCKIRNLNINHSDRGNITVVENSLSVDFEIKRVYYLYDIPGGEERGGHAHRNLRQLIIAASGSFDVVINDGAKQRTVHLNRSYNCLEVVPGIWRELKNFSSGSICLVLASLEYDEKDYIRDYQEFIELKK